jgi:hypothetical protein
MAKMLSTRAGPGSSRPVEAYAGTAVSLPPKRTATGTPSALPMMSHNATSKGQ